MSSIGERFKKIRKGLGFNQKDFAKELGISQTHISSVENGKDNPSTALIKLLCLKYNIDEEWLVEGKGDPDPGWDMSTDDGAISKYNAMRVTLERRLQQRSGEDLTNTVQAFSFFESLITPQKLNDAEASEYLKFVRLVIDEFEKLIFKVSCDVLIPPENNAKAWLKLKNDCDEKLELINTYVKEAANLYLSKYGDEAKL